METVVRVAKNTGVVIIGKTISGLLIMAITILLARSLGANRFGIYCFVFIYLGFFGILMDLGVKTILVREISRDRTKANKLLGNAIVMRIILSVFALILACSAISFLKYPFDTKLLIYIASLSFLVSFSSLYEVIFQIDLKMKYPALVNILNVVMRLLLFVYLIYLKAPLLWFVVAYIITLLPGLFIILRLSRKFIKPKFEIDFGIWRKLLKESWPIALTAAFIMLHMRIDQIMLFQMKGPGAIGHYAAAVRLTEALNILPAAFMVSVFPLLSKYFIASREKLEKAYHLSFKYMAIIIVPIAMGVCILSEPIIRLVYGNQFLSITPVLRILIWSEIFVFLGVVHLNILISVGLQKLDFIFTLSGAVANIILNFLLIPHYGIIGASIATVISYGLGVPLSCILIKTRKYGRAMLRSMLKPFIVATIMGCFTYFAFLFRIPLVIIILSSGIVYFAFIILIRGLDTQDLRYFKKIMVRS